jgi:CubicO group peptidase (beta-lactamase class C family)
MTAVVPARTEPPASSDGVGTTTALTLPGAELDALARQLLGRRPAVGLALGVVRGGDVASFFGHGLADIPSKTPITEDTVFRIGSVTKLFTAIAIMQLWEQGLVDLDAPADDYLQAFRLVAADPGFRPATMRHLLTHTAGIPEVRGLIDLLHADLTPSGGRPAVLSVRADEPLPSLAEYYRAGLRVVVEPGTTFAYTNHGFATLGQIVEDVSGLPLERYLRERLFEPLGMADTELVRSKGVKARLATGYVLGRRGPEPVSDRDWIGAGAGGIYSTTRDMARFTAALLGGGGNQHGRILEPATLATMFAPHFQPDPRISGIGLGFFRSELDGHQIVSHDGILPGFNSALLAAPDDGVGIIAFTIGSPGAFAWLPIELARLVRRLLRVPDEEGFAVPHHPETWRGLCGRYVFQARISDLRIRLTLSRGVEVTVVGGRLVVRLLTPLPLPLRGLPLLPDDEHDPDVYRLDLSAMDMQPVRVVFGRGPGGRVTVAHSDLGGQPWSLVRCDGAASRRAWLTPALGAFTVAGAWGVGRRWSRRRRSET